MSASNMFPGSTTECLVHRPGINSVLRGETSPGFTACVPDSCLTYDRLVQFCMGFSTSQYHRPVKSRIRLILGACTPHEVREDVICLVPVKMTAFLHAEGTRADECFQDQSMDRDGTMAAPVTEAYHEISGMLTHGRLQGAPFVGIMQFCAVGPADTLRPDRTVISDPIPGPTLDFAVFHRHARSLPVPMMLYHHNR
jgi:hypothetical protein